MKAGSLTKSWRPPTVEASQYIPSHRKFKRSYPEHWPRPLRHHRLSDKNPVPGIGYLLELFVSEAPQTPTHTDEIYPYAPYIHIHIYGVSEIKHFLAEIMA